MNHVVTQMIFKKSIYDSMVKYSHEFVIYVCAIAATHKYIDNIHFILIHRDFPADIYERVYKMDSMYFVLLILLIVIGLIIGLVIRWMSRDRATTGLARWLKYLGIYNTSPRYMAGTEYAIGDYPNL